MKTLPWLEVLVVPLSHFYGVNQVFISYFLCSELETKGVSVEMTEAQAVAL